MFRFRECREKAGLSQKSAAIALGVKSPSISDWESGRTNPACDKLPNMAKIYGVTIDELLGVTNMASTDEEALLRIYRRLNEEGRAELISRAEEMAALTKWTQEGAAISG